MKKKIWPSQKPCKIVGCKNWSIYARTHKGKKERYCARHWRSEVESSPSFQKQVRESQKSNNRQRLGITPPKKRKVRVKRHA